LPCCKAKEYKWCSEQDTVYTDEKGNKYCVFHAPEKKGQTEDNFNKLIFERIQEAIDGNRECNLDSTIFPDSINFSCFRKKLLPQISFIDAIFNGDANFKSATFSGWASFNNAMRREKDNSDLRR